jgi:hypothetical protein
MAAVHTMPDRRPRAQPPKVGSPLARVECIRGSWGLFAAIAFLGDLALALR